MKKFIKTVIVLLLSALIGGTICACGTDESNRTVSIVDVKNENVNKVESMINELGNITVESENSIIAAEKAYRALTENERSSVDNYEILVQARKDYDDHFQKIYALTKRDYHLISSNSGSSKGFTDYKYNEKGQILSYKGGRWNSSGKIVYDGSEYSLEYDDDGNLISRVEKYNGELSEDVAYQYNNDGLLVKKIEDRWVADIGNKRKKDSHIERSYTYTFDAQGRVETRIEKNKVDDKKETSTIESFTYNEDGLIDTRTSAYPNGKIEIVTHSYDENGNLVKAVNTTENGEELVWNFEYECIGIYEKQENEAAKRVNENFKMINDVLSVYEW